MPTNESNDLCKLVGQEPLLILLGGATCGGKSTLADRLQQTWINCKRLSQDDFFREEEDPEHAWVTLSDGRRHQNWEHLQSVDWAKMKQAARHKIESFGQVSETGSPESRPILILEGHLVLSQDWNEFSSNQIKFFFTIDRDNCHHRRMQRKYIPEDPPTYFDDIVWPMQVQHENHIRSSRSDVIFLCGTDDLNELFSSVEKQVRACV